MGSPLFDLAARLGVTGASEAQAGLKGVETQAQATSAALDKVMSTADFTHSSYSELLSGQRALETSMSGQLIPAIARTTTVSFEADRAIQGMARSVLFVASTGNLAGRGMAGFIANVSRLIGPGSILLSALAIGGLAVDAFFNRFEKGEEKAEKAAKKAIDAIVNPLTEKDEEKRRLELFAKRAELEDKITTLERARSEKHAVGISDTFLTNLLSDLNQAKSDLDIVNRQIADATRIIDALSAQKAAREDAERAMADARAEIEQRAQERQTATDEGHIQQAKKALGFQQEAQALLAKAEASYRAMGVSADQIKKNIVDADAEMQRHLARGARTEAVTEAGREDRKKPEKAKQDKEDELSHLEDRIALLREGAEVQSTAAATLLKLSETEALLRAQLQETNLSLEERIRLGGNLDSVLEAEKVAQQTIRSFSVPKASEQTLAQRIKAVLTPNWVEIKQEWIQSLGDFGRTIGQGIQNVFASLAAGGPNAKHAISNLGKTVLAGLGTMISEFG
ncbi:MAG TPA: hypothetical protein VNZ26_11200, partial [Vicinamibacterales bacterium]|nr:hypothetical protein [Vicinamibacterales bacterium]